MWRGDLVRGLSLHTSSLTLKKRVPNVAHFGHRAALTEHSYSALGLILTRIGIVNVNVEPAPTWLVTQILPP